MKGLITLALASFLGIAALHAQIATPPADAVGSSSQMPATLANAAPQIATIRILAPPANQKLESTNVVDVRFEIVDPTSSAWPSSFLIQLDGQDPVRTTGMEQTFTDLAQGTHSVTVQMVDANDTPLPESRAIVEFQVLPQSNGGTPSRTAATGESASIESAIPPNPQPGPQVPGVATQEPLPSANSLLPLISVIGFGVLVGGIASAMKTR